MAHAHTHANEHATSVPADYNERLTSDRDDLKSLGNCYREFMHHFSGQAVAVAIVLTGAARIAVGDFTYRDILTLGRPCPQDHGRAVGRNAQHPREGSLPDDPRSCPLLP